MGQYGQILENRLTRIVCNGLRILELLPRVYRGIDAAYILSCIHYKHFFLFSCPYLGRD